MENKEKKSEKFYVVSGSVANRKIKELTTNPTSKAILDEYFMWVSILNSPISLVESEEKSEKPIEVESK